jgi:hypothetical protein
VRGRVRGGRRVPRPRTSGHLIRRLVKVDVHAETQSDGFGSDRRLLLPVRGGTVWEPGVFPGKRIVGERVGSECRGDDALARATVVVRYVRGGRAERGVQRWLRRSRAGTLRRECVRLRERLGLGLRLRLRLGWRVIGSSQSVWVFVQRGVPVGRG